MESSALRAWGPLVAALVLNAAANVLLKLGASAGRSAAEPHTLVERATGFLNGITLAAMMLFGLNVLLYRKALEGLQLSVAYPVMLSGTLLLATLAARWLPSLQERISPLQLLGMVLVVAGVWLVTRG